MELPNKIGMDERDYLIVQRIYRGWAGAGVVLFGALGSTFWLSVLNPLQPNAVYTAFALLLVTLATFNIWVFPVNRSTNKWATVGSYFKSLRAQWEYTHAANAMLTLLASGMVVAACLNNN